MKLAIKTLSCASWLILDVWLATYWLSRLGQTDWRCNAITFTALTVGAAIVFIHVECWGTK